MLNEEKTIRALIESGEVEKAALLYMQLAKSMCLHFVEDCHYDYFDDMYSPDYVLTSLTETFEELNLSGKLTEETSLFLREAWKEIEATEAFYNYGVPSRKLKVW
jgi:predicted DNA-binding protein with PD1-like motif